MKTIIDSIKLMLKGWKLVSIRPQPKFSKRFQNPYGSSTTYRDYPIAEAKRVQKIREEMGAL